MKRVGFWWRFLAAVIDLVILCIGLMLITVFDVISGAAQPSRVMGIAFFAWVLIYTTTEVAVAGTPGKRMLGLMIGQSDGTPADRWRLILRWSTKMFPWMLRFLFLLTNWMGFALLSGFSATFVIIGCLFAANDDKLAWHDQWSGTAVYRARDLQGA